MKIVNYYAVVFLLRPPNLVRRGPFFERKNVCNSQENGVRTRCAAIVNHPAVLKILRVVNLLRVVFLVRRGPLGLVAGSSHPLSPPPTLDLSVPWSLQPRNRAAAATCGRGRCDPPCDFEANCKNC